MKRAIAILISGRGSNMTALIAAASAPDFPARIAVVVSNVADAAGLDAARKAGIATEIVDHRPFGKDREGFERTLDETLARHGVELVCLAGFMRLLTPWFVGRWDGRMLNVHPALLPAFKGLDTHARALASGVKIHGATVHFVSAEMDSGPIVMQGAVAVLETDTAETLAARVLAVEHRIYPLAVRLVAAGKVAIRSGRCFSDGEARDRDALIVP